MLRKSLIAGVAVAAALAASTAFAASGKLVLYTSQPDKDAARTVAAFNKLHPDVSVEIFRSGTTEVMNKLRAELAAGDPRPDVLLIADVVNMESLKRDGRLLAYPDAPVGPYGSSIYDPGMTYFGTKLITTGIVYHTDAPIKPTSWKDLIRPEVKGQVTMPSPLYSGAAALHLGAVTRTEGLGWDYYERPWLHRDDRLLPLALARPTRGRREALYRVTVINSGSEPARQVMPRVHIIAVNGGVIPRISDKDP